MVVVVEVFLPGGYSLLPAGLHVACHASIVFNSLTHCCKFIPKITNFGNFEGYEPKF